MQWSLKTSIINWDFLLPHVQPASALHSSPHHPVQVISATAPNPYSSSRGISIHQGTVADADIASLYFIWLFFFFNIYHCNISIRICFLSIPCHSVLQISLLPSILLKKNILMAHGLTVFQDNKQEMRVPKKPRTPALQMPGWENFTWQRLAHSRTPEDSSQAAGLLAASVHPAAQTLQKSCVIFLK